jgi:hypothetical protein
MKPENEVKECKRKANFLLSTEFEFLDYSDENENNFDASTISCSASIKK